MFKAYLAYQGKTVTQWFDEQVEKIKNKLEQ
jgi:hypothetical protein